MTRCHHYRYESVFEPRFGVRTEVRDGRRFDVPVLLDAPEVLAHIADEDFIIARATFYDRANCPICKGGPCPECNSEALT